MRFLRPSRRTTSLPRQLATRCCRLLDRSLGLCAALALLLAVLAPLAQSAGHGAWGVWMATLLARSCHQDPTKSWHLGGHAFALCARCTGVYAGALLGRSLLVLRDGQGAQLRWPQHRILISPFVWLALLATMFVDWWLTHFFWHLAPSLPRATSTGFAFGIGWMLGPHRHFLRAVHRSIVFLARRA